MRTVTDELALEQDFVDTAYASLTAMQARTQHVFDRIMATGGFQDLDHEVAMRRRIALLGDSPRPLLFGRIDESDGEHWYIGRRHVEDERADPVVVEWRTPVAEPFYQARPGDATRSGPSPSPHGRGAPRAVDRRRRLRCRRRGAR